MRRATRHTSLFAALVLALACSTPAHASSWDILRWASSQANAGVPLPLNSASTLEIHSYRRKNQNSINVTLNPCAHRDDLPDDPLGEKIRYTPTAALRHFCNDLGPTGQPIWVTVWNTSDAKHRSSARNNRRRISAILDGIKRRVLKAAGCTKHTNHGDVLTHKRCPRMPRATAAVLSADASAVAWEDCHKPRAYKGVLLNDPLMPVDAPPGTALERSSHIRRCDGKQTDQLLRPRVQPTPTPPPAPA